MTLIKLGKSENKTVTLDVGRLIPSRLLVTGTSGSGKSWTVRKIIEEASAHTQTIVIDPEGEFSSLREIRDVAIIGPEGDAPADPRYAGRLAKDLMEFRISAVIDIQELTPARRREYVANFCNAMVDLPRSLWRPCFVIIDEVHEFAPNSQDKSYVSGEAVSLLFSKGRKRGFCPIVATTRLAKVSMDLAAEAKNRLIGNCVIDVDQKRAADFLGFGKERWSELRDLSPPGSEGEFFGVGPAFNVRGVFKMRIGEVQTTHPKAGQGRMPEPPQPSAKMQKVLAELKNLPVKAEEEIKDLKVAKQKIAELTKQCRVLESSGNAKVDSLRQVQKVVEQQIVYQQAISKQEIDKLHSVFTQYKRELDESRGKLVGVYSDLHSSVEQLLATLAKAEIRSSPIPPSTRVPGGNLAPQFLPKPARRPLPPPAPPRELVSRRRESDDNTSDAELSAGGWEIINACAQNPDGLSRPDIKTITGYRKTSIQTYVPKAIALGYLESRNGIVTITDDGMAQLQARGLYVELPTGSALLAHYLTAGKLPEGEQKILEVVSEAHPLVLSRKEIGEKTGYQKTSIQTYVPKLKGRGLVVDADGGLALHDRLQDAATV